MRTSRRAMWLVTAIAATMAVATLAPGEACADFRVSIELQTAYLHEPHEICAGGRTHRILISGTLDGLWGGRGELLLDANECGFNEFGDLAGCTKVGYQPIPIVLKPIKTPDPFGAGFGRRLYEVTGEGLIKRLLLVAPETRGRGESYRLVTVSAAGVVECVEALEPR